MPPGSNHLLQQIVWLFVLAIPVSCVAWTITHEEVFREPRDYCVKMSERCASLVRRKFFYLFTCEYCFSHYVTAAFLLLTGYRLLLDDWRGYVISFFAVVWVANAYMSLFSRLRVDIRSEKSAADVKEKEVAVKEKEARVHEKQIEKLEAELAQTQNGSDGR
jgi:hypothetical protein